MRLVQVISDYIRESLLTTRGDLIVRGATAPERLIAGALNLVLTAQGAGNIPIWAASAGGRGAMKIGTFSRSTAGTLIISGVGFLPSLVIFFAVTPVPTEKNFSIGFDFLTEKMCLRNFDGTSQITSHTDRSLTIRRVTNNWISGNVTAFSGDGFSVTFTQAGTVDANVTWLALE